MKKRIWISVIIMSVMFTACGEDDSGYIDIGETTIEIKFKEATEQITRDIIDTAEGSLIALTSIIKTMEYYELAYEETPEFMWRALTMMLNGSDEAEIYEEVARAPGGLVRDYFHSCFGGLSELPELAGGVVYNAETDIYAVPRINVSTNTSFVMTDLLDNYDGTYTAYISYYVDGNIDDQYIFTLVKNKNTSNISNYDLYYSVVNAALIVL